MPRQPQFPRDNASHLVEAAAYERGVSPHNAIGGAPVMVYLNAPDESRATSRNNSVVEESGILAFQHLHLVLAIPAQRPCEPIAGEGDTVLDARSLRPKSDKRQENAAGTNRAEIARHAASIELAGDPVIRCLSDALAIAERAHHRNVEVYAGALRLAVAIKLLGLRSEAQPAQRGDHGGRAERPIRALQKWRLKRVVEHIEDHLSGKVTLLDLAAVAGLSRMHFASQFRAATGLRPHEYLLRQRIRRADELLRHSTMTIVEVALTVGFQTQAHFTTVFKRFVGCTPLQWRNLNGAAGRSTG